MPRKLKLKPKPSNPKMSISALSEILGLDRKQIRKHEAAGGAPKRNDIEGWQVFLASVGRTSSDTGEGSTDLRSKLALERFKIAKETAIKLKRENRVKDGELIDFAEAKRQVTHAEGFYFNELDRMERELPAQLSGLDPAGIRDVLSACLKTLRERSREKFGQVTKT